MKDEINNYKISVVLPTYNRANTIKKSIDSILGQSFKDFELIIIDDGSTDNTKNLIEEYKDNRIKYFYQKNSGACSARNYGIKMAQGDYIAFIDSDDIWHEDKLQKQYNVISKYDVDVVFCKMRQHNINSDSTKIIPKEIVEGMQDKLKYFIGIGTQTLLVKKDVFSSVMFDPLMPRFQDLDWLVRTHNKYKFYCIDEVLVDYFLSTDSISKNNENTYKACLIINKKYKDFKKNYYEMSKYFHNILIRISYDMYKNKDKNYAQIYKLGCVYGNLVINKIEYLFCVFGLCNVLLYFRKLLKKI